MKRSESSEPIYGTKVLFLFGGDSDKAEEMVKAWFAKYGGQTERVAASECRGRSFRSDPGLFAIWVKRAHDFPTLVHEIVHVGIWMMSHIELEVTDRTDEAMAYYCDWLMREALKA